MKMTNANEDHLYGRYHRLGQDEALGIVRKMGSVFMCSEFLTRPHGDLHPGRGDKQPLH